MEQQEELKIYLLLKKQSTRQTRDAILHARLIINGRKPVETSTRIVVPVVLWDQKNQQIRNRMKNLALSQEIEKMVIRIEATHEQMTKSGCIYCSLTFTEQLHGKQIPKPRITYLSLYEKHQSIYNEDLAPGTWKNYRSTHLRFKEFLKKEFKVTDMEISGFNRQLIIEFIAWLKKRKADKGQRKCSHTTAQKHTERIVRLLSFAVEMQYIPYHPIVGLKKKHVPKSRTCLDQSELETLEQHYFDKIHLEEIRDTFLFSCYTGLSYGDILSLNQDDLITDINGNKAISKVREKTHRNRQIEFFVPLLPPALDLLEKYKGHYQCRIKNVLLPVRCNASYNRMLKQICTLAGIDKNLTIHVARHTFATTVTQDNNISLEAISEMLGHTQIRTTQIYIRIQKQVQKIQIFDMYYSYITHNIKYLGYIRNT